MKKSLRCGCAAHAELSVSELAPGLPARQCPGCEGSLLELDDYRRWRDNSPAPAPLPDQDATEDGGVRHCPACARLMQRLRVGAKPNFRVDRCAGCQALWFDRGEWAALAASGLASRLEEILSDAGQRQLQAGELRERREAALRHKHGDACIDEIARMHQWLRAQPAAQREELLSLLRAGW